MQKIDRSVFDRLPFSNRGIRKPARLLRNLDKLAVNEGLLIKRAEWSRKTKLSNAIPSYIKKHSPGKRFTVRQLAGGKGWATLRVR